MSVSKILNELPKLTEAERRAVLGKLLELAAKNKGVSLCNRAALEGAKVLDKLEEQDKRRKQQSARITKLPDFRARREKIFPKPIPKSQVRIVDRLLAGG